MHVLWWKFSLCSVKTLVLPVWPPLSCIKPAHRQDGQPSPLALLAATCTGLGSPAPGAENGANSNNNVAAGGVSQQLQITPLLDLTVDRV